ncbi:Mediator of RNA polymerase II transcription subunit 17 [Cercospora zeina]
MILESRSLHGQDVAMKGMTITFRYDDAIGTVKVELNLVSLDDDDQAASDGPQDAVANAIMLAARLLLRRAHRRSTKQKTEIPAPMTPKDDRKEALRILAPILIFMGHSSNIHQLNKHASRVGDLFKRAQLPVTVHMALVELPFDTKGNVTAESLLEALFRPLLATATIEVGSLVPFKLTVGTSPEDFAWYTFSFIKEGEAHEWTCIEDLVETADEHITDTVAQYLASQSEGWKLQPSTGGLMRKRPSGKLSASLELHTDDGTLMLQCAKHTAEWTLEDNIGDARSIVTALAEMVKD